MNDFFEKYRKKVLHFFVLSLKYFMRLSDEYRVHICVPEGSECQ